MSEKSGVIYFHAANERPFGPFSTFARYGVFLDDHYWPTVEHYYQAQKFLGTPHLYDVLHAPMPEVARRVGRDTFRPLRADWKEVRVEVMRRAVTEKFYRYPELYSLLLSTGELEIVKKSRRDAFWGCAKDGKGENRLGKIIMDVRDLLRRKESL